MKEWLNKKVKIVFQDGYKVSVVKGEIINLYLDQNVLELLCFNNNKKLLIGILKIHKIEEEL